MGMYTLKRPQVSRSIAAKRMEHRMIDRNSIKKQLRRAGLYVMEEQVRALSLGSSVFAARPRVCPDAGGFENQNQRVVLQLGIHSGWCLNASSRARHTHKFRIRNSPRAAEPLTEHQVTEL